MEWLASNNATFLFSEELHDVEFEFVLFENKESGTQITQTLYAHSQILAFASEVFRSQLFGVLQERTIKIEDANVETFKHFLRFIYTGEVNLSVENMFELAYLAKKYLIAALSTRVHSYFKGVITDHVNFWDLFNPEKIALFDDEDETLLTGLLGRFKGNPWKFLDSDEFLTTSENTISQLVRCEELAVREFDLYCAVVRWAEHQCFVKSMVPTNGNMRGFVKGFLHSLRLPTLGITDLTHSKGINTNNLVTEEEKSYLLCYVGGQLSARVPFGKMPRTSSPDLFLVTTTRFDEREPLEGDTPSTLVLSTHFFCRLAGVTCEINTKGFTTPAKIVFELRRSKPEHPVYKFEWVSDCMTEVENFEITCMTGDIIPIYANTTYTLVARSSESISMNMYKGHFMKAADNSKRLSCVTDDVHVFKSFSLLKSH